MGDRILSLHHSGPLAHGLYLDLDVVWASIFSHTLFMDYQHIITIEPGKRSGKPCIRGMRITVYDILEYLASGMTEAEILEDFSELTQGDIRACIAFATQ
jgi:uncharacterized protein (DUF433 family)